jgi:hypothetical protein
MEIASKVRPCVELEPVPAIDDLAHLDEGFTGDFQAAPAYCSSTEVQHRVVDSSISLTSRGLEEDLIAKPGRVMLHASVSVAPVLRSDMVIIRP